MARLDTNAEYDDLKKDIAQVQKDLNACSRDIKSLVDGELNGALADGRAMAKQASEAVETVANTAAQEIKSSYQKFEDTVHKRPLASIAAAFGIGALVATLLDRTAR